MRYYIYTYCNIEKDKAIKSYTRTDEQTFKCCRPVNNLLIFNYQATEKIQFLGVSFYIFAILCFGDTQYAYIKFKRCYKIASAEL